MAFIIIAEHVYFVWRHAGMFSPHTIPAISMLYQTSPQSTLVIEQASNAIAEYFTATEWSTWGYIIDIVQRRKIRNQAKDILQEKLYNIILENRLDKTGL
ncbi:hypothetical protein BDZ94DRAFT_1260566 [Collybia nuda]|uniref:Uncharacterized protein n=1 Tax=Collybia nuda TaxID=64659 RepID=A0A9P5Y7G2_9AGAR|nr:hypothetical protein BDZ94DRAFT_1260566 [Collybia nuda]